MNSTCWAQYNNTRSQRFVLLLERDTHSNVIMQALDLVPEKIHERSPIFLGSYDDVEEIKNLYAAEEQN